MSSRHIHLCCLCQRTSSTVWQSTATEVAPQHLIGTVFFFNVIVKCQNKIHWSASLFYGTLSVAETTSNSKSRSLAQQIYIRRGENTKKTVEKVIQLIGIIHATFIASVFPSFLVAFSQSVNIFFALVFGSPTENIYSLHEFQKRISTTRECQKTHFLQILGYFDKQIHLS